MNLFILLSVIFIVSSYAFPTPKISQPNPHIVDRSQDLSLKSVVTYLQRFGYLTLRRHDNAVLSSVISQKDYHKSIRKFQKMMGLKPTGELNSETKKLMSLPRCGVEDDVGKGFSTNINDISSFRQKKKRRKTKKSRGKSRARRYVLEGGRWRKNAMKYHIVNYTPDMTRSQVRTAIRKAFELWSNQTNLEFIHTDDSNEADIKISFGAGNHGDSFPFDGPGGELAHAYYPSDGRAHFDEDEKFLFEGQGRGIDLFTVAAHEFGHNLGLRHSSVPGALMAPVYRGYIPNLKLHPDDIEGIQALYGKKKVVPKKNDVDLCKNLESVDSIHFDHHEDILYAFKGKHVWKIGENGILPGYPRLINKLWKKLPKNIDASVNSMTTGRTYFFKGNKVWRYDDKKRLERGFPQPLSAVGLPPKPDSAVQWRRDGMIYIFKNNDFYQFSEYQRYNGGNHYGKWKINQYWRGAPAQPDAVFRWKDGNIYFLKKDKIRGFPGLNRPMLGGFPQNFRSKWLKCKQASIPHKLRLAKKNRKIARNRKRQRRLRNRKHKKANL